MNELREIIVILRESASGERQSDGLLERTTKRGDSWSYEGNTQD